MTRSVYDAMPIKLLEKIEYLDEIAREKERQARMLEADAQDLHLEVESIVGSYRMRVEQEGWEKCWAEARRKDAIAWQCDPLPGAQS